MYSWCLVYLSLHHSTQLPSSVCSYQEFNYTIFIENISDNHTLFIYGPFYHQGSGSIKEDIAQGLRGDKDYSLRIVFRSYFYEHISYNHTFGKYTTITD